MRTGSSCSFCTKQASMELEPGICIGIHISSRTLGKISMRMTKASTVYPMRRVRAVLYAKKNIDTCEV
jgi:hypothetical protein